MKTRWIALAAGTLLVVGSACGGSPGANRQAQAQCFTAPTPEERAQFLEQYGKDNVTQTDQTVCVIDGNTQRYYNRSDGFSDYLMYSLMFGRSNALLGYGVLSGDLNVGDAIVLSMLTGVNGGGGIFHPYGYSDAYGWGRQRNPTIIQNVHVTNVQYGSAAPQRYTGHNRPPAAYKPTPIPKPSKAVGTVGKDAAGKPAVTLVKKADASKIVSGRQAPPAAVKNAQSTATTIPNASRSKVTAPPSKAKAAPKSKTPSKQKPGGTGKAPSAKTPSKPATKAPSAPKAPGRSPSAGRSSGGFSSGRR